MYRQECIDKCVQSSMYRLVYVGKFIDKKVQKINVSLDQYWQVWRQVLVGNYVYVQTCMYIHLMTNISKNKNVKSSIEPGQVQNRIVMYLIVQARPEKRVQTRLQMRV